MRKALILILAVLITAVFSTTAYATVARFNVMSGTGPHNHNGNSTMDYYWTNDKLTAPMRRSIADINDTKKSRRMPEARRVFNRDNADVVVVVKQDLTHGGRFKTHHRRGIDRIAVGPNADGGKSGEKIYIHELMHSYSEQHVEKVVPGGCDIILHNSVMCSHSPGHLTGFDNWNLRRLPNKWVG